MNLIVVSLSRLLSPRGSEQRFRPSFQTYRVEFSTIFRIITSFDRRFLSFFSSLSFPLLFSLFSRTPSLRARRFIRLANNPAFKVSVTAVFNRSSIPTRYLLLPPLPLPSPQNLATLQTNARTRVVFVRAAWRIGCVRSSAIRDPCPIRPTNKVVPVTSNV